MGVLGQVQVVAQEVGSVTLKPVEEHEGDGLGRPVSTNRPAGSGSSVSI